MYGYAYFDDIQVPFWFGPKASGYCIGFANPDAPKTEEERLAVVAKSTGDKWAIVNLPPYMSQFLDQPVMFDGVEIGTSQENQTSQFGHWFHAYVQRLYVSGGRRPDHGPVRRTD